MLQDEEEYLVWETGERERLLLIGGDEVQRGEGFSRRRRRRDGAFLRVGFVVGWKSRGRCLVRTRRLRCLVVGSSSTSCSDGRRRPNPRILGERFEEAAEEECRARRMGAIGIGATGFALSLFLRPMLLTRIVVGAQLECPLEAKLVRVLVLLC